MTAAVEAARNKDRNAFPRRAQTIQFDSVSTTFAFKAGKQAALDSLGHLLTANKDQL